MSASPRQKARSEFKPVPSSRPLRSLIGAVSPSKKLLLELALQTLTLLQRVFCAIPTCMGQGVFRVIYPWWPGLLMTSRGRVCRSTVWI